MSRFILNCLRNIFGADYVSIDTNDLKYYGRDWSRQYEPSPTAIVFPKDTTQIEKIVELANKLKLALVPSGGRTGMSGGAVAMNGEIVVAFDKMNKILDFNSIDRSVVCQPGVITKQLQIFANENRLYYPIEFASDGSSQIAGNIATNAGGNKVIRYGNTRDWVSGLKVVTGKGDILNLNKGLIKNNSGYDLRHLFIGSEGTLGFITEATIRLTRLPSDVSVMLLACNELNTMVHVLNLFQTEYTLTSFEFFTHYTLEITLDYLKQSNPVDEEAPVYLLLELESNTNSSLDTITRLLEHCIDKNWVITGVLSQNETQANKLWKIRETIPEAVSEYVPYRSDISIRVSLLPKFILRAQDLVSILQPKYKVACFGHAGDGNIHFNILKPNNISKEVFFTQAKKAMTEVFNILESMGGSITAEHGVGLIKKQHLHHTCSESEIDIMRNIKRIFDPNWVMNPGKIFNQH